MIFDKLYFYLINYKKNKLNDNFKFKQNYIKLFIESANIKAREKGLFINKKRKKMLKLTKSQFLNNFKVTTENVMKQTRVAFSFSFKNHMEKNNNEFNYEYNKYNAPNILFDKEKSKEIEKSFGRIIERYEQNSKSNNEAKKGNNETCKMKPIYKYSSCDYIPRVYFEGQNEEDNNNIDNNVFDE